VIDDDHIENGVIDYAWSHTEDEIRGRNLQGEPYRSGGTGPAIYGWRDITDNT